ncbi:hypothetical protein TB1_037128 [Malus domestica]
MGGVALKESGKRPLNTERRKNSLAPKPKISSPLPLFSNHDGSVLHRSLAVCPSRIEIQTESIVILMSGLIGTERIVRIQIEIPVEAIAELRNLGGSAGIY